MLAHNQPSSLLTISISCVSFSSWLGAERVLKVWLHSLGDFAVHLDLVVLHGWLVLVDFYGSKIWWCM